MCCGCVGRRGCSLGAFAAAVGEVVGAVVVVVEWSVENVGNSRGWISALASEAATPCSSCFRGWDAMRGDGRMERGEVGCAQEVAPFQTVGWLVAVSGGAVFQHTHTHTYIHDTLPTTHPLPATRSGQSAASFVGGDDEGLRGVLTTKSSSTAASNTPLHSTGTHPRRAAGPAAIGAGSCREI